MKKLVLNSLLFLGVFFHVGQMKTAHANSEVEFGCVKPFLSPNTSFCEGAKAYLLGNDARKVLGPFTIFKVVDQFLVYIEADGVKPFFVVPNIELAVTSGCTEKGQCVGSIIRSNITSQPLKIIAIFSSDEVFVTNCLKANERECKPSLYYNFRLMADEIL